MWPLPVSKRPRLLPRKAASAPKTILDPFCFACITPEYVPFVSCASTERAVLDFMVEVPEVLPDAWYQWSISSKRLNAKYSLGTVRFTKRDETREKIEQRADEDHADANLCGSRGEAMARIHSMRAAAPA